jgi:hypothetical protein
MLFGCASKIDFKPHVDARGAEIRVKSTQHMVLLRGVVSTVQGGFSTLDDIKTKSMPVNDPYPQADIQQLGLLGKLKNYTVVEVSSVDELYTAIKSIANASTEETQLVIGLSGECDKKGFITNLLKLKNGLNLVPPGCYVYADALIERLGEVKGKSLLIINGCQSGTFADAAKRKVGFTGGVIAACPVGYATTQCEATGTTALYAGVLALYQENPTEVQDLAKVEVSPGRWVENLRHHIADWGASGLPISYDSVSYFTCSFLF